MRRSIPAALLLLLAACGGESAAAPEPVFDPKAPGPPEFPGGPLSEPFPWIVLPAVGAAAAAVVVLLVRHRRLRAVAPAPHDAIPATAETPHDRALRRLQLLRRDEDADIASAAAILREYIGDRAGLAVTVMTSEELLARPALVAGRAHLADVLLTSDAVKFARATPSREERARVLSAAETFVSEMHA